MNHSIRSVSRRTGLPAHVIRVWERRYAAVTPTRTPTNRRLYSEADIEHLALLSHATKSGYSIGQVAALPIDQLRELLSQSQTPSTPAAAPESPADRWLQECLQAVGNLDAPALESTLSRATLALGTQGVLHLLLAPLTRSLGELWRSGEITAAQEHFASAVIRTFLATASRPFALADHTPKLIVTTPAGQLHELGAVMVGALAANLGWRVLYLGTSLPATEIAGTAIKNQVRAVALSIVYPDDDPHLGPELELLRRLLPAEIKIVVGGRAASSYRPTLDRIGALQTTTLEELNTILDNLRLPSPNRPAA